MFIFPGWENIVDLSKITRRQEPLSTSKLLHCCLQNEHQSSTRRMPCADFHVSNLFPPDQFLCTNFFHQCRHKQKYLNERNFTLSHLVAIHNNSDYWLFKNLFKPKYFSQLTIGFFTIRKSDAFLSDYLTDLKLHRTK